MAGGGGGGAAGLLGTTGVSFGGTPAAGFQVLGDARLTAVTPAHASGTVDVTVTTPAGTSATAPSDRFAFEETGASLPEAPETGSSPAKPLASPPIRGFC